MKLLWIGSLASLGVLLAASCGDHMQTRPAAGSAGASAGSGGASSSSGWTSTSTSTGDPSSGPGITDCGFCTQGCTCDTCGCDCSGAVCTCSQMYDVIEDCLGCCVSGDPAAYDVYIDRVFDFCACADCSPCRDLCGGASCGPASASQDCYDCIDALESSCWDDAYAACETDAACKPLLDCTDPCFESATTSSAATSAASTSSGFSGCAGAGGVSGTGGATSTGAAGGAPGAGGAGGV